MSGACQWSERGSTTTTFSAVSPRAGGNHLGGHPDFLVVLKGDHQLDGVVQENRHGLRCETRSEVPLDLWAPNRVQQKVWWRSGLHVVSTPGTGRTCRRLPSFQPVLYAISSESLSPQKFDYSSIAGSGDHSATLSLSAVKLICWQKNQLQPQSDLLHGRPWAATLPRLSHRTSFDTLWNMLDCKSYWVGSGSRSTSSAEQLFVKLSLSCRCGILRPLEVISFAFAIACSLKSENWKGKAMCCQEATISSDNLPAPFPQLIGSAGGSPLATSAGSHAGTLDPSDPGSQIQAWIHIPVVDGVDDHPSGDGICLALGFAAAAPLIRMPFPFAGVAPFAVGRRPLSRASISFPPPLPLSKGKVPLGPASTLRLTLRLRNRKAFASTLWFGDCVAFGAYPLGAFRPPYACHTKQGSATFETSKSNHFWRQSPSARP